MSWLHDNRRAVLVVGATIAVPFLLVAYFVVKLWALGYSYQAQIDGLEPRIARLIGARQAEDQLVTAASKAKARVLNLVYSASDDSDTVSATLQKNVRGILSGAGLVVVDSRIDSAKREGALDVIGLAVSVSGSIDALDAALTEVVSYSPLLLVTDISAIPARASRRKQDNKDEQVLTVKMHLLALRDVE